MCSIISGIVQVSVLTNGIGWFVVFHNIKSLDLLCFVHSENPKNHECAKDDYCSYCVPDDDGTTGKCVPHEHLERRLSSPEKDPSLDEEGRSKETPRSGTRVNSHCIQWIVNLEQLEKLKEIFPRSP